MDEIWITITLREIEGKRGRKLRMETAAFWVEIEGKRKEKTLNYGKNEKEINWLFKKGV